MNSPTTATVRPPTSGAPSPSPSPAPKTSAAARLGWLDALRGLAALVVALHHFGVLRMLPAGKIVGRNFDLGLFGVMLFFIVSGYIIPASLERRGDVRGFWIGRFFRIHPALIVTIVVSLLVLPSGDGAIRVLRTGDDLSSLITNGLLLQDVLGVTNGMNVTWTLCYEMVFYFFVTALFTRGLHRHSAPIAAGCAALALAVGTAVGERLLTPDPHSVRLALLVVVPVVLTGFAGVLSGRPGPTRAGALLLAGLGLVLVTLNSRAPWYETWTIFATMFAGTAVYRAQHSARGRVPSLLACGFVVVSGVLVGWLYNRDGFQNHTWTLGWISWSSAYLAAWAVFGLGFLLRRRRFPRVLTWLGAISFSVYLVHVPLVHALAPVVGVPLSHSALGRAVWAVLLVAAALAVSHLMYRLVEIPVQNLGRRVQKAAVRRWPAAAREEG
ncbi:peptidoglycan/LPS O-acetylase OafA/YrhL [Streptomyces sp. 3211.6]|uniref:acyltransferase family protein n=1 Tax=Streptomyces sp. 3211.6 TaxID=1938845 RepID=UPI000F0ED8A8|nr:acyltransferase [Streptomyces sp. 3211.6]RKT03758.1 peptidoglycan/LPS O-acetylase OafA/YrhL [Streptomyces sp. 3211.6]